MIQINEYFGGKVKSLSLEADGDPATLGVISKGEFEFGTGSIEIMKVISGVLDVLLPDSAGWVKYPAGTEFTVQKNVKFKVRAEGDVSYLCLYR